MRIAVGMTIGEIVKPGTTATIALMAWHIGKAGHNFSYISEQSAYLDQNANHVFERSQKLECDYLMLIETDVGFLGEDDVIGKMMAYKQDVVSGVYFGGKYPHRPLVHNFSDTLGELQMPGKMPEVPFFMNAVGSGFMLLSKKVLDAFTPKAIEEIGNPFDFAFYKKKLIWRQDIAFCWRLKKLGFRVLIDPTIQLGHYKEQTVTRLHWDMARDHMERTGVVV